MNSGLNILDQLLMPTTEASSGFGQTVPSAPEGKTDPSTQLFARLLTRQLLMDNAALVAGQVSPAFPDLTTAPDSISNPIVLASVPLTAGIAAANGSASMPELLSPPGSPNSLATSIDATTDLTTVLELPAVLSQAPSPPQEITTNSMPACEQMSALPEFAPIINPAVRALMQSTPIELKAGSYDVLSAVVASDNIRLEVVASGKSQQPITLTIPSEVFTDAGNTTAGNRVALAGFEATGQKMTQLLAELNVEQIEVNQVDTGLDSPVDQTRPVAVTLLCEGQGQRHQLKSLTMPSELQAMVRRSPQPAASVGEETEKAEVFDELHATNKDHLVLRPAGPQTATAEPARNTSELPIPPTEPQAETIPTTITPDSGIDDRVTDRQSSEVPVSTRPVRFELPNHLNQALKANGHAVMIRIHPEHLGAARLKLSLRNDVLTATLTVDSSDAKSVIEGSLDKLTQQLHKADVKVDRIEVNLAGEEPQQQSWFDRRPDWTRRPRHWSQSNENETSDIAATWTPSLTSASAAVSTGTLNILA